MDPETIVPIHAQPLDVELLAQRSTMHEDENYLRKIKLTCKFFMIVLYVLCICALGTVMRPGCDTKESVRVNESYYTKNVVLVPSFVRDVSGATWCYTQAVLVILQNIIIALQGKLKIHNVLLAMCLIRLTWILLGISGLINVINCISLTDAIGLSIVLISGVIEGICLPCSLYPKYKRQNDIMYEHLLRNERMATYV